MAATEPINPKVATILRQWMWSSDALANSPLKLRDAQFFHLLKAGSVRLGSSPLRADVYAPGGAKIFAHLSPKRFGSLAHLDKQRLLSLDLRYSDSSSVVEDETPNHFFSWQPIRAIANDFLLVDKLAGIPSIEPGDGAESALAPHWLRRQLPRRLGLGRLSVTSRLDAGTHGLIVVGRNPEYTAAFNSLLQIRGVQKRYTAVVRGWDPANSQHHVGLWTHFYPRRNGAADDWDPFYQMQPGQARIFDQVSDPSKLQFRPKRVPTPDHSVRVQLVIQSVRPAPKDSIALRCFNPDFVDAILQREPLFELEIDLLTGKTHQIRAQLWAEGISIVGDWLYGSDYCPRPDAFALCCSALSWKCPTTNSVLNFSAK